MRRLLVSVCVCATTLSSSAFVMQKPFPDIRPGRLSERTVPPERAIAPLPSTITATDDIDGAGLAEMLDVPLIDIPIADVQQAILGSHEASEDEAEMFIGPPAPPPKPVIHRSHAEVCETLATAAEDNDLPAPFFIRLLLQESGFRPGVVSPVGAQGVAQFMPATAAQMGLDNPFDPLQAIPASARLLRMLFERFGNLGLAAAAYNAGPKRIQDWLARKGKLPSETRGYVKTITGRDAENWKDKASAGIAGIKLPRISPCQREAGLHAWDGPDAVPLPPPSLHSQPAVVASAPALPKGPEHTARPTRKPTIQLTARQAGKKGKIAAAKMTTASRTAVSRPTSKSKSRQTERRGRHAKPGPPLQLAETHR